MTNLFDQGKRLAYIAAMENQLSSATMLLDQFTSAVLSVAGNWAAYASTSPDAQELADTRAAFEAKAEALKNAKATALADALSIIAGACPDGAGGYLTLDALCAQLVAAKTP